MNVPARIANILINALKGGVVPRVGLEYITVGRTEEIAAILRDIEMIEEGGASFRFIVGKYGSGKSFLLQTIRNYAAAKGFAVSSQPAKPTPPAARVTRAVWPDCRFCAAARDGSPRPEAVY